MEELAYTVQVTSGPWRNVVIKKSFGTPKITKNSVTVAKPIEFSDKSMFLGAPQKTNVGDVTITITILLFTDKGD